MWIVLESCCERIEEHRHLTIDLKIKCHRSMLIPFELYLADVIGLILNTQAGLASTTYS